MRYHYTKFIKRNRNLVILTVGLLSLVVVSFAVTAWQWRIADTEKARAQQRYNDVRQLANGMAFDINKAIKRWPGSTEVRLTLLKKGASYLQALAAETPDNKPLLEELAEVYHNLATIQGNVLLQNVGDTENALQYYKKSIEIREGLLESFENDAEMKLETAETYRAVIGLYSSIGQTDKALVFAKKCTSLMPSVSLTSPREQRIAVQCYLAAAHAYNVAGDYHGAKAMIDRLRALYENKQIRLPKRVLIRKGRYFEELSQIYALQGDKVKALEYQQKFVKLAERFRRRKQIPMLAYAYHGLGKRLVALNRLKQAEKAFNTSYGHWRKQLELFPNDARRLIGLAGILVEMAQLNITHADDAAQKLTRKQINKSCDFFQQSEHILQKLPNPSVGYGVRIFNMPSSAEIRVRFQDLCKRV